MLGFHLAVVQVWPGKLAPTCAAFSLRRFLIAAKDSQLLQAYLREVGEVNTIWKTNKSAVAGTLVIGAAVALAGTSVASAAGTITTGPGVARAPGIVISGQGVAPVTAPSNAAVAVLTRAQANGIFNACRSTAAATHSTVGRPGGTKMWCAVLDREGATLLIQATDTGESPGSNLLTDAWRASIEIAEAKAYTALSVSSNDQALSSFDVGLAARPDAGGVVTMVGHDPGPAPLFGLGNTNPFRSLGGDPSLIPDDRAGFKHHGIVTFAGGQPVYNCSTHKLLGGVGVSGDGVDEDDTVAKGAVTGAGFGLDPTGKGCTKK